MTKRRRAHRFGEIRGTCYTENLEKKKQGNGSPPHTAWSILGLCLLLIFNIFFRISFVVFPSFSFPQKEINEFETTAKRKVK